MHLFYIHFFALLIAVASTQGLQVHLGLSAPFACALTGLVASFISPLFKKSKSEFELPFYVGSFVGMCGVTYLQNYLDILGISFLGLIFYSITKNQMLGVGGRLGTIAFLTSMTFIGIKSLW